jgi:hypothetical protein
MENSSSEHPGERPEDRRDVSAVQWITNINVSGLHGGVDAHWRAIGRAITRRAVGLSLGDRRILPILWLTLTLCSAPSAYGQTKQDQDLQSSEAAGTVLELKRNVPHRIPL